MEAASAMMGTCWTDVGMDLMNCSADSQDGETAMKCSTQNVV